MQSVTAQRELHIRFEEDAFVTQRSELAENPVDRAGAKSEVVTVDSTHWRAGNIDFVELFFDPAAVASRQFQTGEQNGRKREIRFMLDRDWILALHVEF